MTGPAACIELALVATQAAPAEDRITREFCAQLEARGQGRDPYFRLAASARAIATHSA